MATIHTSTAGVFNASTTLEMNTFVAKYWGGANDEKIFPIPLWKLKQLISNSTIEAAALKVTDITNLGLVNAEWIGWEEGMEVAFRNPARPGENYFVITEATFEAIKSNIPASTPIQLVVILGRIGENEAGDTLHAFFHAASCVLIGGSGGGGSIGGAKVPST